jgi:adenosylmethionine-8-amino-7-oxononanoate aminotransferase
MIAVHFAEGSGAAMSADDLKPDQSRLPRPGLLVSLCGSMVLRTPPLVVTREETVLIAARLGAAIADVTAGGFGREREVANAH